MGIRDTVKAKLAARDAEKRNEPTQPPVVAAAPAPREPSPYRPKTDTSQRLPHGSVFHMSYDATAVTWSGSLTIIHPDGSERCKLDAQAGSVVDLCSQLDRKWRAFLRQETPTAAN
jgi:hypothetical protein